MSVTAPAAGRRPGRWPVVIACHDSELSPYVPRPTWHRRPGHGPRPHCTHCGSIHPGLVYTLFGERKPTAAPAWRRKCPHGGHSSPVSRERCVQERAAHAEAWWGVTLAEPRGDGPQRFYVYTAASAQMTLDARHLLDLDDVQFRAVARVLAWHTGVQVTRTGADLDHTTGRPW